MGNTSNTDLILLGLLVIGGLYFFAPDVLNDMKDNSLEFISTAADKARDDTITETPAFEAVSLNVSGLTIANWNIQIFGDKKASNPELMRYYTDVIDEFDIVFIQEIRDADGSSFQDLCDRLVADYNCLLSSRAGRSTVKEQYGIIYRKGIDVAKTSDYNPDSSDRWERPPIMVEFDINGYLLTTYNIHVKPSDVQQELAHLEYVALNTGNVVVLGDLNADCNYYDPDTEIEFDSWNWVIGDDERTNLAATGCAYDRIIMNDDAYEEYITHGVYTNGIDLMVSDHYLVWAAIKVED